MYITIHYALTLAILALCAAAKVHAAQDPLPWHVGAAVGPSRLLRSTADFSDGSTTAQSLDRTDSAWKLFGGYSLNRHFAVEAAYVDLQNATDRRTTYRGVSDGNVSDGNGGLYGPGPVAVDIDQPRALAVSLLAPIPLSERLSLTFRLGLSRWSNDRSVFQVGANRTSSESGVDLMYGAAAEYAIGQHYAVRLEWERYEGIAREGIDLLSAGLIVRFGH